MLCYYKRWKFYSFYDYGHVVMSCNNLHSIKVTLDGYTTGYNPATRGMNTSLLDKQPHFDKDKWDI